jgi:hypothetical protein
MTKEAQSQNDENNVRATLIHLAIRHSFVLSFFVRHSLSIFHFLRHRFFPYATCDLSGQF